MPADLGDCPKPKSIDECGDVHDVLGHVRLRPSMSVRNGSLEELMTLLDGPLGWTVVAIGGNSERDGIAARGRKAVIMSLITRVGIVCTSGLVFAAYSMAA
ncbi:hypothetical protein ACIRST_32290 [Kitasatospora sp. NPDC101447]|uniref:hypothetical protein n=1 Tax=Kitasatospora sp. NPDC101447 TaxID=3364102 RepID=UPI00381FE08D